MKSRHSKAPIAKRLQPLSLPLTNSSSAPLSVAAKINLTILMTFSQKLIKPARQIHLYIGIFISPAILFFGFSGALQTFGLHQASRGSGYKPPTWIVHLSRIHKNQTATIPVPKPRPASEPPRPDKHADATASPTPRPAEPPQKSHLPMKIFFLLVSIGLFTSTLTGLFMAYKFNRNKLVVTALLLAGIIVPLLLLPF